MPAKVALLPLPSPRLRESVYKPSVILNVFQDPALSESGLGLLHGGC